MSNQLVTGSMEGFISVENVEYYYENKKYKGAQFIIELPINM